MSRKQNQTTIRANIDYFPRRSVRGNITIVRKSRPKNPIEEMVGSKTFWQGAVGGGIGTGAIMGMVGMSKRVIGRR
jgi:hypothetical protein